MVLLTMTTPLVEAIMISRNLLDKSETHEPSDPSLEDPAVGKPISHGQILDTWRTLRTNGHEKLRLEGLLRGTTVYTPPPPPKPEPTDEYKALMARLRREEEERSYERMIQKAPMQETFAQRFPNASMAHSFSEVNKPSKASDLGDDNIEYGDVQKQVTLLINFLVSIVGCGAALWKATQWWPVSTRLFLSLGGAIAVAITEVVVYSAFSWRMSEGGVKELKKKDAKEIIQTWVVGEDAVPQEPTLIPSVTDTTSLRRRNKDVT
ncbi:endoplasmic reticulum-based factor for assembly of V-ATPase-domain-containing protein [Xylariaceae sp. FL0255]|nr:endoplasmic reticulum-based factor for assembly of V-ATPase-domain-containing protein [Xylariaceae sp. FL0255]